MAILFGDLIVITSPRAVKIDHIVYPGESIEDIAEQYRLSVEAIREANGMTAGEEVKEGQRIKIPIAE